MQDFEKLGVFYLGKEFDLKEDQMQEEMVLYKSKDLTTHAVIIGMTGSVLPAYGYGCGGGALQQRQIQGGCGEKYRFTGPASSGTDPSRLG